MTRLESFAAAALTGLLANNQTDGSMDNPLAQHKKGGLWVVEVAFEIADAMDLKALEYEEEPAKEIPNGS